MNTFYKYYLDERWDWLFHPKVDEAEIKRVFRPVYEESAQGHRLFATKDYDSTFDNRSFTSHRNTVREQERPLETDLSSHSYYHDGRSSIPQIDKSSQMERNYEAFRASDDNPLGNNISKYYKGHQDHQMMNRMMERDTSYSNFERAKENEARLRFSVASHSDKDIRPIRKFFAIITFSI